ncbi:MAG: methyltransferase domain-containing protein [Helicobacter sp.]|nr:methyltransferase domain-containing protein [Helicobacteraceae bacterium]MDY3113123.1 methyltransferase domain-containing protein [Helicobacter sp.]
MEILEKSQIQKSFNNAKESYKISAKVQQEMQEILLLSLKKHLKGQNLEILELGCGDGRLCKKMQESFKIQSYLGLDLVDFSQEFNKMGLKNTRFLQADFERLEILENNKFNCILSNAALQWCRQEKLLKKLHSYLYKGGILCFSTFGKDNFKEIKTLFNISLPYLNLQDYTRVLVNFNILESFVLTKTLEFKNTLDIFRHIKSTGVNALKKGFYLKKGDIKEYEMKFKNRLTYHCLFIVAQVK